MNNMNNILLQLIDDIELLLKQDNRFFTSNDYLFKNKINKLNYVKPLDVTSLINLSKLNTKSSKVPISDNVPKCDNTKETTEPIINNIIIEQEPIDLTTLHNIVSKLKELNSTVDRMLS